MSFFSTVHHTEIEKLRTAEKKIAKTMIKHGRKIIESPEVRRDIVKIGYRDHPIPCLMGEYPSNAAPCVLMQEYPSNTAPCVLRD
jgi:hypothetical protein